MKLQKERNRESYKDRVNRVFLRFERSEAYAEFCRRVFGKNLCQVSMVNMVQLKKLVSVLRLNKKSRVLDMGCGLGGISEYISDITNAHVTGVDFASEVIKRAKERTKKKKDRLVFRVTDIRNPRLPEKSFDAVITIDTLYFVKDLGKTIRRMRSILTPGGQMALFYTQVAKPDESLDMLKPEGTKLGQALKQLGLKFHTWNYTEYEKVHWKKRKRVAMQLIPVFRSERNLKMCRELIKEAEHALEFVKSNRISRYLYHVRLPRSGSIKTKR